MSSTAAIPTSNKGLDPQLAQEALASLRRAIEKMKSLQATERVIASIERASLNRVPEKFDLKQLVAAINELNLAIREGATDKIGAAKSLVSLEMETVCNTLIQRDEQIMPYHLRRFCDQDKSLLDLNAFASLTSFYRTLTYTEANRGKYDFVVTRLFTAPEPRLSSQHRYLRTNREQIAKRLTEMCAAWGEIIEPDTDNTDKIIEINSQFDEFITAIKQVTSLEELIGASFFQRVRDFKASVGAMIYIPEVTAGSVESNVMIANRFLTLLALESEEIREAPENVQVLADVFCGTYSNESTELSQLLNELQKSSSHPDYLSPKEGAQLSRLLQMAIQPAAAAPAAELPLPEIFVVEIDEFPDLVPEPAFTTTPAAQLEMDGELEALAASPENRAAIEAFLTSSIEVRRLEINSFLAPLPEDHQATLEGESELRREALQIILRADHLARTELADGCQLSNDIQARLNKLFEELERVSDETRVLIKETRKQEQPANNEVLLHVYNQLMGARLRLQSAIVRRSAQELAQTPGMQGQVQPSPLDVAALKLTEEIEEENTSTQVMKGSGLPTSMKWMITVGILLLATVLTLRFVVMHGEEKPKDDSSVVQLSRDQMPQGEFIAEVKLRRDLMLCTVDSKWSKLSADEKKEKFAELANFGKEKGAQTVMLIDGGGNTLGLASGGEINIK